MREAGFASALVDEAFNRAREQLNQRSDAGGDAVGEAGGERGGIGPAALQAGGTKLRCEVYRARKLVRLYADETNEAAVGLLQAPNDLVDRDDRVALVIGIDLDRDIRAKRAPITNVPGNRVKAGKRVRRN